MVPSNCILCRSPRICENKNIDLNLLLHSYKKYFHIDVSEYFKNKHLFSHQCADCDLIWYRGYDKPGSAEFYETLSHMDFYYDENRPEFAFACKTMEKFKPKTVLEVGCGKGAFLSKIKSLYEVKGMELNPSAISKLQKINIEIISDIPTESFDWICAFQVLEHIPDVRNFIENMTKGLKRGGYLLLSVPNPGSNYFREVFDILDYPPHHLTRWTKKALFAIADIFQLEIVEYFQEKKISLVHLQALLHARRKNLKRKPELLWRILYKLLSWKERVFPPNPSHFANEVGVCHGILLHRKA